jgi:hypothetical protein
MTGKLFWWLENYKDQISLLIQALLFLATIILIRVGWKLARAADSQAEAADEQVKAANAQVVAANAQVNEMRLQGQAARRPFFKIDEETSSAKRAILCNVGPGVALKTTWRFLNSERTNKISLGTVGVGMPFTLYFAGPLTDDLVELTADMIDGSGILIECEDAAGKFYRTAIKRIDGRFEVKMNAL